MSPCYIRTLTPEGIQRVDYTADSLTDAVQHESPDGVYTVANTFNIFQVLLLDAHLDRLETSADHAKIPIILNRQLLRSTLREMIAQADFGSVRFRITIEREKSKHMLLSLEPYSPPSSDIIDRGVRCMTLSDNNRSNPMAKTTDWMHNRKRISLPNGIYEGLLLDPAGNILEGMGSNFYAVRDNVLRSAGDGVLQGIARRIVADVAPDTILLNWKPINVRDIADSSEAFITSSSRGIIPVIEVDGITIGAGIVGHITKSLQQAYNRWVEQHLEDL